MQADTSACRQLGVALLASCAMAGAILSDRPQSNSLACGCVETPSRLHTQSERSLIECMTWSFGRSGVHVGDLEEDCSSGPPGANQEQTCRKTPRRCQPARHSLSHLIQQLLAPSGAKLPVSTRPRQSPLDGYFRFSRRLRVQSTQCHVTLMK